MKKIFSLALVLLLFFILTGCSNNNDTSERNEQIYEIYELAVVNGSYNGEYEDWLETVRGPQGLPGEDGRELMLSVSETHILWKYEDDIEWTELLSLDTFVGMNGADGLDGDQIELRMSSDYIQWKYTESTSWSNLISVDTLIGNDGSNGREVEFQVENDVLQWRYTDEMEWTTLIEYNRTGYYLTDSEINYFLQNYDEDIIDIFPTLDISQLATSRVENSCVTSTYDRCILASNELYLYGEGFEKYIDKQESVQLLSDIMSIISDLMGEYDSVPIVPGDNLSGTTVFASVVGRNDTSILFEGEVSAEAPISLPFEIAFTYELLIYKDPGTGQFYIEGNIDVSGGILFLELSAFNTRFLSEYDASKTLNSVIYTTDFLILNEWLTVMTYTDTGKEVYSTNNDSMEYFSQSENNLEVLYSNSWYDDLIEYSYELYIDSKLQYIYDSSATIRNITVPAWNISGWEKMEYTKDGHLLSDDEFLYEITLSSSSLTNQVLETPLETEETWILLEDYSTIYYSDGIQIDNASNIISIKTSSITQLGDFMNSNMDLNINVNMVEYVELYTYVTNYTYGTYNNLLQNKEELISKFNLR